MIDFNSTGTDFSHKETNTVKSKDTIYIQKRHVGGQLGGAQRELRHVAKTFSRRTKRKRSLSNFEQQTQNEERFCVGAFGGGFVLFGG